MPLIEVRMPKGALSPQAQQQLADKLTEAVLRWEGAPAGSRLARQLTWVSMVEADGLFVAGQEAGQPRYVIRATVPQHALRPAAKAGFVADATAAVVEVEGGQADDAAFRVWCIVEEVPDGNWGADGRVVTFEDIVRMVTTDG